MGNNFETIIYTTNKNVAYVTLNRPEVHNAFNDTMLTELTNLFTQIAKDNNIRIVVITGNGKSFCAGADVNWMKKIVNYTYEENIKDSNKIADCMYALYTLPQPTIARVNGHAIGGGMGFVGTCDIVISVDTAQFSLSEVKIGLVPACISPYIIRKVGEGGCREFFITGERLTAEKALKAGLVNSVVPIEKLDSAVEEIVNRLLSSGPNAIASCKELLRNVPQMNLEDAKEYTVKVIAKLRVSEEGQEGMNAFLEKRKPKWVIM